MPAPDGFAWTQRKNGDVLITHNGRRAVVLSGDRARTFLDDVERRSDQELVARITGNYKCGNGRQARNHPRNSPPG